MPKRIGDIIEERAGLVEEMRGILDKAETESRDLTAEERQEYDRKDERVGDLTGDIRRHERAQEHAELDVRAITGGGEDEDRERPEGRTIDRDSDEYRDAFNAYCRGQELSAEQRSTLKAGTDAEGGYAVAEQWTELHERLREAGTIRQHAEVITTETGGTLHVPREKPEGGDAAEPDIVPEGEPIPDDADELDEVKLNAYKIARITKAEEEMVQDALFDVAGYAGRRLGFQLGRRANWFYVNGSGSNQPQGLFVGAPKALTLASKTAISPDEVIDLTYAVKAPYRAGAGYMANDTTIGAIRKVKDSAGQYLWQPSLQAGTPDTLNGYPVFPDPDVPVMGAVSKRVLGFGNIELAYIVRDVLGVTIKFLDQRYADRDQVAWRGKLRTDGGVIDPNAFKVAETPSS